MKETTANWTKNQSDQREDKIPPTRKSVSWADTKKNQVWTKTKKKGEWINTFTAIFDRDLSVWPHIILNLGQTRLYPKQTLLHKYLLKAFPDFRETYNAGRTAPGGNVYYKTEKALG